jgi:hypothetical protein
LKKSIPKIDELKNYMEGGFYGKKWMPREYYLSSDGLSEFEIYLRSKDDESITAIKDFESELSIFFD